MSTTLPSETGGAPTRTRLLEAAGEMFALHGFEGTTAKEICLRAGVNPAAVNYHFGGLEGLYEAVLSEARARIVGAGDGFMNSLGVYWNEPMVIERSAPRVAVPSTATRIRLKTPNV